MSDLKIDSSVLPLATSDAPGAINLGYTENGRNYPLEVDSNNKAFVNAPWTDTKNTAGAGNTGSAIYLIGATTQTTNPTTYSHNTVFVDTDGCLYSGTTKSTNAATMRKYKTLTYTADSFNVAGQVSQPLQYDGHLRASKHTVNCKRFIGSQSDYFLAGGPLNICELYNYQAPSIDIILTPYSIAGFDTVGLLDPMTEVDPLMVNPSRKIILYLDVESAYNLQAINFLIDNPNIAFSWMWNKVILSNGTSEINPNYVQSENTYKVEIDAAWDAQNARYYICTYQYLM